MTDQRNLILAIVLSIAIVIGFEFLYAVPKMERERAQQAQRQTEQTVSGEPGKPPTVPQTAEGGAPAASVPPLASAPSGTASPPGVAPPPAPPGTPSGPAGRQAALGQGPRVAIDSGEIHGSIALTGGRLDDVALIQYRESTDPGSPAIELLSPPGAVDPYFVETGWIAAKPDLPVPNERTVWTADGTKLTPTTPVTLSWDNGQGLRFERRVALDEHYMFTVTDRVTNQTGQAVSLHPYSLASRWNLPKTAGFFILHEGPVGVFNGKLKELSYSDLSPGKPVETDTKGGWIGITDKYWLVALIPDQGNEVKARFSHNQVNGQDRFQIDWLGGPRTIAAGETAEVQQRLFAGAKRVRLLDAYTSDLGIDRLDLAIDFGWFYFLTKPIFYVLEYFHRMLGNFGLAILLLTVLFKLAFFPLANKSYRAMSKMKLLQPEMEKLKEKFGEDRQRLSQEMMALYKREGANPLAGCLPIIIQIPVFFALYKVLFVTIEMRHAVFYGWIHDLSQPDPTSLFTLFGLIAWTPPQFLHIGAWPLIMGLTMFLQQKMNPQPPDPVQAKVFLMLPVIFTVMLAGFPAGLVIYWAWNNLLSIAQQWVIMRSVQAAKNKS